MTTNDQFPLQAGSSGAASRAQVPLPELRCRFQSSGAASRLAGADGGI